MKWSKGSGFEGTSSSVADGVLGPPTFLTNHMNALLTIALKGKQCLE